MKRVLIISPYFPPSNAADMQRVRTSLPYLEAFGWKADVICVDQKYTDIVKDELLLQTVPTGQPIYPVNALNKKWTSKFGLGSLALRSMWYFLKEGNRLLNNGGYDLIYFSTTQFPVTILGSYWKNKFGVPYIIDIQDPWHSDYYQDKPKSERPKKYWLSYRLNKWLEPIAMKNVDGLISVSENYINVLKSRYPRLKNIPAATITFGTFQPDFDMAINNSVNFKKLLLPGFINIVYAGRGGMDMHQALIPVFTALQKGLLNAPDVFSKLRFYFIGTSYASAGKGIPTILPLALKFNVADNVIEITDRLPYFHALATLQQADALFIPGSDDPDYTASKVFPYLLAKKPLLTIFNKNSSAVSILREATQKACILTFPGHTSELENELYQILHKWANGIFQCMQLTAKFDNYSAETLTGLQVALFNEVVNNRLVKSNLT